MRTNRVQFHLDMLCMTCSEPSWCFAPLLRLPCIRLHLICKHDRDDDVGDNGDGDDDDGDDFNCSNCRAYCSIVSVNMILMKKVMVVVRIVYKMCLAKYFGDGDNVIVLIMTKVLLHVKISIRI